MELLWLLTQFFDKALCAAIEGYEQQVHRAAEDSASGVPAGTSGAARPAPTENFRLRSQCAGGFDTINAFTTALFG